MLLATLSVVRLWYRCSGWSESLYAGATSRERCSPRQKSAASSLQDLPWSSDDVYLPTYLVGTFLISIRL